MRRRCAKADALAAAKAVRSERGALTHLMQPLLVGGSSLGSHVGQACSDTEGQRLEQRAEGIGRAAEALHGGGGEGVGETAEAAVVARRHRRRRRRTRGGGVAVRAERAAGGGHRRRGGSCGIRVASSGGAAHFIRKEPLAHRRGVALLLGEGRRRRLLPLTHRP